MASVSPAKTQSKGSKTMDPKSKISESSSPAEPTPKLKKATAEDLFGIDACNAMKKNSSHDDNSNNYIPSNRKQEEYGPKKRIKP
jgi:hypothetical protein